MYAFHPKYFIYVKWTLKFYGETNYKIIYIH